MAEENERQHRQRNVIPYDRAFGAQNGEPDEADNTEDVDPLLNAPYPLGSPNLGVEDAGTHEEEGPPLEAARPLEDDRDPESIRSEWDDNEAAQEIAEPMPRDNDAGDTDRAKEEVNEGNGLGITGLILSLISIFIWPAVLAPAGIIVGYIGFRRGSRTTGIWAMVIGAFSLLMALFILPTYFR